MNYMPRKDEMGRKTTGIDDQRWRLVHDKTQFLPEESRRICYCAPPL